MDDNGICIENTRCICVLWPRSAFLEIDALIDFEAEQTAAQRIEREFDRSQSHPLATAEQSRRPRNRSRGIGETNADRAAEFDAIFAFVNLDQHGESVRRAANLAQALCDRDRALLGDAR